MRSAKSLSNSHNTVTLVGIYSGFLAMMMLGSGLPTILSAAALQIGGVEIYPLASTIGGLLSVVAMPFCAFIGARKPERKRTLAAACMFISGVCICVWSFAPSMTVLVVFGLGQSMVSVGVYILGFAIIREMYDQVKAGVFLGMTGTIMGVGGLIGPLVIGALLNTAGWRACFLLIWPILFLSGILILFSGRGAKQESAATPIRSTRFDYSGAVAVAFTLTGFVLAISLGASYIPFGTDLNWALIAMAAAGLVALIHIIRKKGAEAIIPATSLADRNTRVFIICDFLNGISLIAVFFFIPTYVLHVMQAGPFLAAMTISFYSAVNIFVGPLLGRLMGKSGDVKLVHAAGALLRVILTTTLMLVLSPSLPIWVVFLIMFVAGFYFSVQTSVFSVGPMIQIKPELRIQSNSIIQIGFNLGVTAGMTLCTFIIAYFGIENGVPIAMGIAAAASFISLIVGLFLRKLPP